MRNATTPEKEIHWSKADRETRMFVFPAEATHPTEESTQHQKRATDYPDRYRRSNCARASLAFNYAPGFQRLPKWRPNQKTKNGQYDKDRQQHTGHESHNEWQRPEHSASREHKRCPSDSHRGPVVKHRFNDLPICRGLRLAEGYYKDGCGEQHKRGTNPRSRRLSRCNDSFPQFVLRSRSSGLHLNPPLPISRLPATFSF